VLDESAILFPSPTFAATTSTTCTIRDPTSTQVSLAQGPPPSSFVLV
jgi:hypothetical protein